MSFLTLTVPNVPHVKSTSGDVIELQVLDRHGRTERRKKEKRYMFVAQKVGLPNSSILY
jgi:hypothetical protein